MDTFLNLRKKSPPPLLYRDTRYSGEFLTVSIIILTPKKMCMNLSTKLLCRSKIFLKSTHDVSYIIFESITYPYLGKP